jgi:hypothetical protein
MNSGWRRALGRIACALGLLLVSQLALAAQPCMAEPGGQASVSQTGLAGCLDAKAAADLCAVKRQGGEPAAVAHASPDPLPAAALAPQAARIAAPRANAAPVAGLLPGHSPPVHILLRRFLS